MLIYVYTVKLTNKTMINTLDKDFSVKEYRRILVHNLQIKFVDILSVEKIVVDTAPLREKYGSCYYCKKNDPIEMVHIRESWPEGMHENESYPICYYCDYPMSDPLPKGKLTKIHHEVTAITPLYH